MVCFSTSEQSSVVLQKIYKAKLHSDITLVAGNDGHKIPAHKIVLEAALEYFEIMFSGPFKEATDSEAKIENIDSGILEAVIKFLYLGQVEIPDMKTAVELFEVSHLMKITALQEHTENYMIENIAPDNCLGLISLAKMYDLKKLALESEYFAVRKFEEVIKEDGFKILSKDEMMNYTALLKNTTNVNDIAKAILDWINNDDTQRSLCFKELLQLVTIHSIEEEEVTLKLHSACIDFEDTKYLVECLLKQQSDNTNIKLKPNPETLLLVKHLSSDHKKILYFYNFVKDEFVGRREIMEIGRVVGAWEGKVVILYSEEDNRTVKMYDLQNNSTSIIGTYCLERFILTNTRIHDEYLYISSDQCCLKVNLKTGVFEKIISNGFKFESCVVFENQLHFLVYKGSDWSTIWLTTNPDNWKKCASFPSSSKEIGRAVVHDQRIYFFDQNKIIVYNSEDDKWTEQLQHGFSKCPEVISIHNKLLVTCNRAVLEYSEGSLKPYESKLNMLDWESDLRLFSCY